MALCRLVGAEPYVAANVGSGTPQEFHDWVSYSNAPAGTLSLADERAANGQQAPFNVKYWGVGNESWGCGGNMTGGEYAAAYRRFISQCPVYAPTFFVATGPRGHSADADVGWTESFFAGLRDARGLGVRVDGFALHYYTDFRQTAENGAAFDAKGWYAVLHKGAHIEQVINQHWEIMGKYDPEHRTKLVIDEWGTWYRGGTELGPHYILSQTITLRDALHAAMTFDIFNRHAGKIEMANIAQTINCLHSLFAAVGDKYTRTPAYSTLRDVSSAYGRPARADHIRHSRPQGTGHRRRSHVARAFRLGVCSRKRPDRHVDESISAGFAGDADSCNRRREPSRGSRHGADPRGHARDEYVRETARSRPG